MAVTDAPGADSSVSRLKAFAPAAGAVGIVSALVAISLVASNGSQAPAAPAPGPDLNGIPGIQSNDQPGSAGALQTDIDIVVKFKDDARVKDIIDTFWRDQSAAKAKFDAWKGAQPDFARLRLDRVTYSNELVLVSDGSAGPAERLSTMRAIAAKLGANGDVSYAEPNMTAHPGGQ